MIKIELPYLEKTLLIFLRNSHFEKSTMIPQIIWFLVFDLFWCKVYPRLGFSCSFDHIHNYFCIRIYSSPLWYGELEKSFFFAMILFFGPDSTKSDFYLRYFSQNTFYVLKGLFTEIFRALCSPKDIFFIFSLSFQWIMAHKSRCLLFVLMPKNFENNNKYI